MGTTEFIFGVIASIGSIATAISLVVLICNQKGTRKQINSLSKMAETYTKIYQIERIKAGNDLNPSIAIAFKNENWFEGIKLLVKSNNYDIILKGITITDCDSYHECIINEPRYHIHIKQGDTKKILLKYYMSQYVYPCQPTITLKITTSLGETYDMSCECKDINSIYKPTAKLIAEKNNNSKEGKLTAFSNKSFSVSGAFHGKLFECFPEINEGKEDIIE